MQKTRSLSPLGPAGYLNYVKYYELGAPFNIRTKYCLSTIYFISDIITWLEILKFLVFFRIGEPQGCGFTEAKYCNNLTSPGVHKNLLVDWIGDLLKLERLYLT